MMKSYAFISNGNWLTDNNLVDGYINAYILSIRHYMSASIIGREQTFVKSVSKLKNKKKKQ